MNCYTSVPKCLFPLMVNDVHHGLNSSYLLSSETTAKGTGLAKSVGKEDPIEIDSSLTPTIDG
ncbi:hypothetical protein G9A89_011828 [Geosiphon pyriformis]|nr:hypothetical protein G9A89_011828 [Geosiphon pyriformis]